MRVFYAAGPGDVVNTFRHWREGRDDPSQMSLTYSAQFFDVCRDLGSTASIIASHPRRDGLKHGLIEVVHLPDPWCNAPGVLWLTGQMLKVIRIIWRCLRFRADVLVAGDVIHWWLLALLKPFNVEVLPLLHCAFWPIGNRRPDLPWRAIEALNGWFWRHVPVATVCVSPESERQLYELAEQPRGPIFQVRAQYHRSTFAEVPTPPENHDPLRVFCATRIEHNKGVFDLLEVASKLERERPGQFVWELGGSGSASDQLKREVERRQMGNFFRLLGQLARKQMIAAYGRCHVMVVPTNSGFAEGLNRVAIESVLAGRPLVTTQLSNAIDVLGDALVEVRKDDQAGYIAAFIRLHDDGAYYARKLAACEGVIEPFYDRAFSWGDAVKEVLLAVRDERTPAPRDVPRYLPTDSSRC